MKKKCVQMKLEKLQQWRLRHCIFTNKYKASGSVNPLSSTVWKYLQGGQHWVNLGHRCDLRTQPNPILNYTNLHIKTTYLALRESLHCCCIHFFLPACPQLRLKCCKIVPNSLIIMQVSTAQPIRFVSTAPEIKIKRTQIQLSVN